MGRMLVELHVRDLGVIDDVTVGLGPGMTALTGETGAGKTLLVGALSLLLGGRADPAVVRSGADEALVEGRFGDVDGGDEITLARTVAREGRSKAWVDGRMVPVGALAEAAAGLIELHGQHQHRALVVPEAQRRALDAFGVDRHRTADGRPYPAGRHCCARRRGSGATPADGPGTPRSWRSRSPRSMPRPSPEPTRRKQLEVEEERLAEASAHRAAAATALAPLTGGDGGPGETSAVDRLAEASGALVGPRAARGASTSGCAG